MRQTFVFIFCCLLGVLFFRWQVTKEPAQSSSVPILRSATSNSDNLKINFLDVGQGDATLINFTNDEQMLVDCGPDSKVLSALGSVMKFYDNKIDYLLVTHPDLDHYGGCEDVLRRFEVSNVITNGFEKNHEDSWVSFKNTVLEEKAVWKIIDKKEDLEIDNSKIKFFYPNHSLATDPAIPDSGKKVESNYTSIVFQLVYKNKKVLFMGDAGGDQEDYLVKKYGKELDSDVLKVGHHGSYRSSSKPFLELVTPQLVAISVGAKNTYGHPSPRTLFRFKNVNSEVYRTDLLGNINLEIGDRVTVVK